MTLVEQINSDLKEFLKAGKSFEAGVLRMIIASFKNKEIEKRGNGKDINLSQEEVIDILAKEYKKRKEAMEIYTGAGRANLAEKEKQETEIIKNYLPEQMSAPEIEKSVMEIIEKLGASGQKDFGKVMGQAVKELKGKADSAVISEIVKTKLGN